jgi:hypothetical protein
MRYRLSLLTIMALMPCLIFAATLSVKQDGSGDYTVIQAALDAASPGDTVLVHPGRYFENLMIETSNITLTSLEGTTGDPAYIDSTIIDGTGSVGGIIVGQYKTDVEIRGFSITNGNSPGVALGASSESLVQNCKIFKRNSRTGGGINVGGATVTLSGVKIFDNYALQLGGGIYASGSSEHHTNITFDPVNRCSIYNNRAGAGQDIYIQQATDDLYMPLDTFSVAEPSNYHATYLRAPPYVNQVSYQILFDILHAHHQEIDSDLYVSTIGSDDNDGLSPATALKTIHEAIYRVAADSLNLNTVHILPGDYSRSDNDQIFPIALKSWVIVQGSGIDTTTVIGEPHSEMGQDRGMLVFAAIREEAIWLSDLSITSRNVTRYSSAFDGTKRRMNMNFTNIRIYDMGVHQDYTSPYYVVYLSANSKRKSVWDNVIIENIAPAKVQLVEMLPGNLDNGEISAFNGSFKNCIFRDATSTYTSSSVMASSLLLIVGDKSLDFDNCEFSNLTMLDDNSIAIGIAGIQYPQQQNHFSFRNCLFSNNSSPGGDVGGIVSITSANNPRIDITNCTFAGNQGDAYTLKTNGEVNITNSIFHNDTPYQIKVSPMDGNPNEHTNLTIDHSLIKDGIDGILPYPVPGNTIDFLPSSIDADPLFAGGFDIHDPLFYSLSEFSPCIDSGTPDISELGLPPYDLAGNQRVWNNIIDMGAFEYGSQPWVSNDDPVAPAMPKTSISAYPNPFNPSTTISYSVPTDGDVSISIYNAKGQLVNTVVSEYKNKGHYQVVWQGKDSNGRSVASGLYFSRLLASGKSLSYKMLLMK